MMGFYKTPEAESIPFDPQSSGLSSELVGPAIRELKDDIETITVVGATFQMSFSELGTASNEWLEYYGDSKGSDESPGVIPFKSNLIATTFTNENNSSDSDIEIYKSDYGDGNNNTLIQTCQVRSCRTGLKTNFSLDPFEPGDKIAVYCRDQGGNPSNVTVILLFQIIEASSQAKTENWTGNF